MATMDDLAYRAQRTMFESGRAQQMAAGAARSAFEGGRGRINSIARGVAMGHRRIAMGAIGLGSVGVGGDILMHRRRNNRGY